jgi:hypothetical protein
MPDVVPLHLPALADYRRSAALAQAEAFCPIGSEVLGMMIEPLTPPRYSMLYAVGNRFLHGGTPREEDVKLYLWICSASWVPNTRAGARRTYHRALAPLNLALHPRWSLFGRSVERQAMILARVIDAIETITAADFASAPAAGGRAGSPLATLEAQMIHEFSVAYGWSAELTRRTPLRQLFQLHRLIRAARGEDVSDPVEDTIKAAHYQRRNAELKSRRDLNPQPAPVHG